MYVIRQIIRRTSSTFIILFVIIIYAITVLQEVELEMEAEPVQADKAETLRDTAPVIEPVKVTSPNITSVRSVKKWNGLQAFILFALR